ncbi:hypothetical protein Q427_31785 [Halomonas sp. BC04]|nr:hypothetical protein Q427_31785 [Halomonas sp. BC04]
MPLQAQAEIEDVVEFGGIQGADEEASPGLGHEQSTAFQQARRLAYRRATDAQVASQLYLGQAFPGGKLLADDRLGEVIGDLLHQVPLLNERGITYRVA